MNRKDRRLKEKYLKQETKQIKNNNMKKVKKFIGPCCYVNSQPIYSGACVFLKKDTEIKGQYDWKLNNLIEQNHRFVIQMHDGKIGGYLVVSLLSTSQYLNEEQRLGIRLSGNYHNNKYVYMDAKNSYIVKSECVKSLAYNLNEDDADRCLAAIRNNKTDSIALHKGLLYDDSQDKAYDCLCKIFNAKLDNTEQRKLDVIYVKQYVDGLPYDMVKFQIIEESKRHADIMEDAIKVLKVENPDLSDEAFNRRLLTLFLATTDSLNITKVAEIIQRGY